MADNHNLFVLMLHTKQFRNKRLNQPSLKFHKPISTVVIPFTIAMFLYISDKGVKEVFTVILFVINFSQAVSVSVIGETIDRPVILL
jgi:hypothetical protein